MDNIKPAPFDLAPGQRCWMLIEMRADGPHRLSEVSDWLVAFAGAGYSPNTLKAKADALAHWWRWCYYRGRDPLAVDSIEFARYVLAVQRVPKGYPPTSDVRALPDDPRLRTDTTVRARVIHVKTFYEWALANGRVAASVGRGITGFPTPRARQKKRFDRLSSDQIQDLFRADLHPRNRYLFEVMYGCGLRKGEALGLQISDLCLNSELASVFKCPLPRSAGRHVHVRRRLNDNGSFAKSHRERIVPLAPRTVLAFEAWQAWAYEHAPEAARSVHIAVSLEGPTRGRALTPSGFNSMWSTQVHRIPTLLGANPHLLRHTFASELLDAGVDLLVVQELLGHASPKTTELYTHAHSSTLITAVERLSEWRETELGVGR